mgnify:CR=1 FL=1
MIERTPDFIRTVNPNAWDNDPEVRKMEAKNRQARLIGSSAIGDNVFASNGKHRMSDEDAAGRKFNINPIGRHKDKAR